MVLCPGTGGEAKAPEVSGLPSVTQVIQGDAWLQHQGFQLLVLHFVHYSGLNWVLDVCICKSRCAHPPGSQGQSQQCLLTPESYQPVPQWPGTWACPPCCGLVVGLWTSPFPFLGLDFPICEMCMV